MVRNFEVTFSETKMAVSLGSVYLFCSLAFQESKLVFAICFLFIARSSQVVLNVTCFIYTLRTQARGWVFPTAATNY
jgi:hypothetical protein